VIEVDTTQGRAETLYADGDAPRAFDHRYQAKARDTFSGLSYFGHRYYDPLTLSWTQADPLYRFAPDLAWAEPRRMAPYTYVLNNPMSFVDPDGLDGTNCYGAALLMGIKAA
jgi:RHS repeat-associated protein